MPTGRHIAVETAVLPIHENVQLERRVIGFTEPSVFTSEVGTMVEKYYKAVPIKLSQNGETDLTYMLDMVDGVILAGGSDIFPGTYGEEVTNGDGLTKFDITRDKREIFILKYCIQHNIPLLLICRGFQLVCVMADKELRKNFWKDIGGFHIAHQPGGDSIKLNVEAGEFAHYVKCLPEFHDKYFAKEGVNSHHHQGVVYEDDVNEYGGIIRVVGTAFLHDFGQKNGGETHIIELIEGINKPIVGCQFHCEEDWMYGNKASLSVMNEFKRLMDEVVIDAAVVESQE